MIVDGSTAISVRGTLLVRLADGRDVTIDLAELDLQNLVDPAISDTRAKLVTGIEYPEERRRDWRLPVPTDPGPPYLIVDARLKATKPGDWLYQITIPKGDS